MYLAIRPDRRRVLYVPRSSRTRGLAVPVLLRAGPVRLADLSPRSSTLLHTTLEPGAPRPHQGAHGSASFLVRWRALGDVYS